MRTKLPKLLQPTKAEEMQLVEVEWDDAKATHDTGGFTPDDPPQKFGGLAHCHDIGYHVRSDSKEFVLATGRCIPDNDYRGSNTIPTRWIRAIHLLQRTLA